MRLDWRPHYAIVTELCAKSFGVAETAMETDEDLKRVVSKKLELLLQFEEEGSVTENDWYRKAQELNALFTSDRAGSLTVPHEIWHYLSDFDIRHKAAEVRAGQKLIVRRFLSEIS